MKTIFIAVFEGVEAKNILRTPVFTTLLKEPNLRLVLFMKSKERAEFYEREFNDPRVFYEVVIHPQIRGLDKFFSRLKFSLLRTPTTSLKRKMAGGGRTMEILNWLIARPAVRKLARFLDYNFVWTDIYGSYFNKYKPDLVFLPHLFDEPETHLLREAKRLGVKSIGFVNSWDKSTARCVWRLLPDKAVVFNEIVKSEMIRHNDISERDIFVSGIPQYDGYFSPGLSSRENFFKRLGLDPNSRLIVYAPMGSAFSGSDWDMLDLVEKLRLEKKFGENISVLARFQPNDFIDEKELKKRPWLKYDYPGIRFSDSRGVDWDMNKKDLEHLKDTLSRMSLLICYASSMSIDAAVFDKPVININFEIKKTPPAKSPTRFYATEHYKNALAAGGIRLVNSEEELVRWVNRYLNDQSLDSEGRNRLVKEQCRFTDGGAGQRIGEFILNYV